MNRKVFAPISLAVLLCGTGLALPAWALYKVVGPDGKVTYTDRAPTSQPAQALKANGQSTSTESLPYELQRVADRYPVTLYSSQNCNPCDAGRQMLKARGIPFVEKSVTTADDGRALMRAEGTEHLPVLRIGQKQLQGYAQTDWASYLDAAGYPAKSALPPSYRWAPASALAPTGGKASAPASSAEAESEPEPKAPALGDTAPAPAPLPSRIRF